MLEDQFFYATPHNLISPVKDGIYLFDEFLNVSLSDTYYSEEDSYILWNNAWDNEINMYDVCLSLKIL